MQENRPICCFLPYCLQAPISLSNITDFVLCCALSMPNQASALLFAGANFTQYITDFALCCPSRTSILTGQCSHNTGVRGRAVLTRLMHKMWGRVSPWWGALQVTQCARLQHWHRQALHHVRLLWVRPALLRRSRALAKPVP